MPNGRLRPVCYYPADQARARLRQMKPQQLVGGTGAAAALVAADKIGQIAQRGRAEAMTADHRLQFNPTIGFRVIGLVLDERMAVVTFATVDQDHALVQDDGHGAARRRHWRSLGPGIGPWIVDIVERGIVSGVVVFAPADDVDFSIKDNGAEMV